MWECHLISQKKKKEFDISEVKKVLFLRYDRIGDMVISTPVFRSIKESLPNVSISVLASPINVGVLANNPFVDHTFINYKKHFFRDINTLINLRRENFDLCIEFDHSVVPHSILRLKIIKPKYVISVFKDGRYGLKGTDLELYDLYSERFTNSHAREIWLNTISLFKIKETEKLYDLFPNSEEIKLAKNFLYSLDSSKVIAINLKGAVKGKEVPFVKLRKICEYFGHKHKDVSIIILYSPSDYEYTKNIVNLLNLEFVFISMETKTLSQLNALISCLDLVISPDTSIVHIASAFNIPVISIHEKNKESFKMFAPRSELSATVFSNSKNSIKGFNTKELLYKIESLNIFNRS